MPPADPIDNTEPIEPMLPTDRIDPSERMDHRDVGELFIGQSW
jgi:hypothetical protein